ncbi:fluoride efflux transporter CrcB [Phenylobacterium sp.]|uniref:fluoride efflux transporter CrcB n=1 Tax=Phenylobacterium sp. TaxID=1871053 RepID=UPI0035AE3281
MQTLLYVGLGGALGAMARYLVGVQAGRAFGGGWPYGTFAVNILGGLLMGLLAGVLAQRGGADQERWRLLLGVGVLGGFTTFSAFSLELALMLERRALGAAALYAVASVALSTLALFAGLFAARRVFA